MDPQENATIAWLRGAMRDTQRSTRQLEEDDMPTDPETIAPEAGTVDRHFHSQPTRIIKLTEDEDEYEDEEPTISK